MTDRVEGIENAVQKAYQWVDAVAAELGEGTSRRQAYSVLRSLFHVLRDRLTVDEASDFAAQLPELLRGVYYEGSDASMTPVKLSAAQFIARFARAGNLSPGMEPEAGAQEVMRVLRRKVTEGEIEDVLSMLPADLRALLDVQVTESRRSLPRPDGHAGAPHRMG